MSLRGEAGLVAAGLAVYLSLALSAARTHSATFDEPLYLTAGYAALRGDYRIAPVHPPLPRMVAAAPLRLLPVRFEENDPAWLEPHGWKLAHRFLYQWNDADRLLRAARAASTLFALLLLLGVYLAARRRWGRAAAGLALLLAVFAPEVLAHGALATHDLASAAFFFLSVLAFEALLERATPWRLAAGGLSLGGALLSKHSALLLGVLLPLLGAVQAWHDRAEAGLGARLGRALGRLAVVGLIAYAVLWAGYRFRYAAGHPTGGQALQWRTPAENAPLLARAARGAARYHLLPEAYAYGLADLATRSQGRRAFLFGDYSREGWWYYFPAAFVLKTPLPLLALFVLAAVVARDRQAVPLWLPAIAFGLVALTTRVNIGVRYLLPMLPFLLVGAGRAAEWLWRRGGRARLFAGLLLVWHVGGTLRHHPHHLSFFNEAAGGPRGGWRYLADSNVDWGQDLARLARYLEENRIPRVRLSYFGTAAPEYYGIRYDLLPSVTRPFPERFSVHIRPGDTVAVSATNLQGVYLPRAMRPLLDRLHAKAPAARVGASIFVYRADFHWLLRPGLAEEAGWLDPAVASYRECLSLDPEHAAQAREYLAAAEHWQGQPLGPATDAGESEDGAVAPGGGLR